MPAVDNFVSVVLDVFVDCTKSSWFASQQKCAGWRHKLGMDSSRLNQERQWALGGW